MSNNENYNVAFTKWLSTYGSVTVQRIFDHYGFTVDHADIKALLADKDGVYYHFLRVPFINILNGIVIGQVEGYREYLQKVFVDYLMSGAANETNAPVQGASIREDLESERVTFIELANKFDLEYFHHNSLIAESQRQLIELSRSQFSDVNVVVDADKLMLVNMVDDFENRGRTLNSKFKDFRAQLQQMIITVQNLIETLPNYQIDENLIANIKEQIHFDTAIGDIRDL